jgi:hypothetical protein
MQKEENYSGEADKRLAGVCGLYCEACRLYIATAEDPARLKKLAEQYQLSEEDIKCYGCRATKRGPYCQKCKMSACAIEQGIDFCIECKDYPCEDLKQFQSAMPHRIELWDNLERIKANGYKHWLKEIRELYTCPQCRSINSAYDLKCQGPS